MRGRRNLLIWAAIAAVVLTAALWLLLAGGRGADVTPAADTVMQSTEPETTTSSPKPPAESGRAPGAGPGRDPADPAAAKRRAERLALRKAERTYRTYIRAINAREGEVICASILPGFLDQLRPPVSRGACAERVSGSIGFADDRGFPVWEATTLSGIEALRVEDRKVQVTAAIVTRFADREQPSVESDIAYLLPGPGGYRLAKASGALWRAVGKPDVPPQVVEPPPGFSD